MDLNQIIGYKVIGNYEDLNVNQIFKGQTENDWSAIYVQTNIEHAMRYIYNKYETFESTCLVKIEFQSSLQFVTITHNDIGNSEISSIDKAKIVKDQLSNILFQQNMPMMQQLGQHKICLIMDDCEGEKELIIPHNLMQNENLIKIQILITFQRHPTIMFRTINLAIQQHQIDPTTDFRDCIHKMNIPELLKLN